MQEKTMLGDFIYKLRKEKNLSQAELGEMVGVSNKAVSKWETNEANPDLKIIKPLAAALGVTTDELLACRCNDVVLGQEQEKDVNLLGIKGKEIKTDSSYEFISERKTKKGTPYIHINLGKDENGKIKRANGIFAIGIISKGIVSLGLVSFGIVSLGLVAFGLIALGLIGFGLLCAVGGVAIGVGVSAGGVAVGTIAVGGLAMGIMSVGGLSVGIWAHTGEFGKAIGIHTFYHLNR